MRIGRSSTGIRFWRWKVSWMGSYSVAPFTRRPIGLCWEPRRVMGVWPRIFMWPMNGPSNSVPNPPSPARSAIGTPPHLLARPLSAAIGNQGLTSQYRVFSSVDQFRQAGLTLAVIRYRSWVDHYVTVFDVTNNPVRIGDPLLRSTSLTIAHFATKWRFVGVVLKRKPSVNSASAG